MRVTCHSVGLAGTEIIALLLKLQLNKYYLMYF